MIDVLPESVGPSRILIVAGAKDNDTSRTCMLPRTTFVTFSTVIVTVPPSTLAESYRLRGFQRAIDRGHEFAAARGAIQVSIGARRCLPPFAPTHWRQGNALRPRSAKPRNRVRASACRPRGQEPKQPACHKLPLAATHDLPRETGMCGRSL